MKKLILVCALMAGCGFIPLTGNYPYDMYDKDVKVLMDMIQEGPKEVTPKFIFSEEWGLSLAENLWGNIKTYKIKKNRQVGMKAVYWVDIVLKNDIQVEMTITYAPNLGRVEIYLYQTGGTDIS